MMLNKEANTGITIVRTRTPIITRVIVLEVLLSFLFLGIGCAPTFLNLLRYKCTEIGREMQVRT